ncbi:RasGEF domain-containing protein [Cavenderia fasciculata]|uniref:non-specific serine/threonine protein kinase n=1 Tax=Cavenderia fasciculata TaxID=261658 RepID=F4Q4N3_CACFS|nr:RasGEF domain-containing protein [Cavenderia fasciculata]EGG17042.1 RasGEF domain-containing protein [Cavenderia fasciculata]|eukprot:XP_004355526.1 RasGEF domain-containing protein [Cavenderia fasciculata]
MAEQDPGLPTQAIWDIPFESLEFKERIGKGSFGSVFKGVYLGLDVAIKKIEKADDPEYLKYIDREVSMLQSLRHPFIVQFSGICVHSTGLYIITEFVSGGDVRQLLKQEPIIGWDKRLSISIDLAKAMVFLHAKKIIHRDLKSKNILLDEHKRIRLCDFGFARMNEQTKKSRHMTMCGTEGWVAPEILLGMSYDTSCDVFSFGVVLAELITGRKPGVDLWVRTPETCFDINPTELQSKALPGCPQKLIDMCSLCCTYEPLSRPKFEEVLKILNAIPVPQPIVNELKSPDVLPAQQQQQQQQTNVINLQNNTTSTTTTTNNNNNNNNQKQTNGNLSPTIAKSRLTIRLQENGGTTTTTGTDSNGSHPRPRTSTGDQSTLGSNWRVGALKPPGYYTLKKKMSSNQTALINHLVKMVERATSDYCYDTSYIQDLLLTYRCFSTPQNLYELLTNRYCTNSPDQFSGDMATWKRVNRVIQLRVVIFFKRWIDYYPSDFQDEDMVDKLNEFDQVIIQNNLAALSLTSTLNTVQEAEPRLVGELTKKRNEMSQSTLASSSNTQYPTSILPPPPAGEYLDVADVNAIELARQFSIINGANFTQIQSREYLEFCWEKLTDSASQAATGGPWIGAPLIGSRPAANIHTFLEHYDDLVRFVSTEIVKQSQKVKRVATLERFIECAERCLQHGDFASVFCIMEGLANSAVERLSDTFNALPETSSPKLLPGGIVNFFHYRQLSRKILFAQQLLSSGLYSFRPVPSIQKILSKPPQELYDDEVIRHYSLVCEPPVSL